MIDNKELPYSQWLARKMEVGVLYWARDWEREGGGNCYDREGEKKRNLKAQQHVRIQESDPGGNFQVGSEVTEMNYRF